MKNVILSYYQLDKFKKIPFDSSFRIEVLELKNANVHRAVFHLYGNGQNFGSDELEQLRHDIKTNLSLSWIGNFAFGLVLHDFVVTDDFHYEMVDQWNHKGGSCIWAIVIDETAKHAIGIHTWQGGTTSNIFEDYLRQYPQSDGTIINKYKTPPNVMRWTNALHHPWFFFFQKTRTWNPCPRFLPPFDQSKQETTVNAGGISIK